MNLKPKNTGKKWIKTKKISFIAELEKECSVIDLDKDPDEILHSLTVATKECVDKCFPPKLLSNKAKKRAEQPWITNDIQKEEREQAKLFRKASASKKDEDRKNYNSFRKKLSKKKKRRKKAYFRELKDTNS